MKEVQNLHTQPVTLSDGTVLAAAGTRGSTKSVEGLSPSDEKRLVRRSLIIVREPELKAPQASKVPAKQPAPTEES